MIEIIRATPDNLNRKFWRFRLKVGEGFSLSDNRVALCLEHYQSDTRPTRRHGWRSLEKYDRMFHEGETIKSPKDVPLPEDVRQEALSQVKIEISLTYPK